ncbi:hypothetical protein [Candidatus Accumulibacter sp. ACC007]|uniref:hypothetical protein n=1 Tax=Candidatus Accumulibacter sp. ACC007 TaxID=2823333 RepID=UPI0025BED17B|nr:hypothetical protein [Candidatus Accumulibacter sp. ACC007]
MNAPDNTMHPTAHIAIAHIRAQGVPVNPECFAALNALFAPAVPGDDQALERACILSSELAQHAVMAADGGTRQTVIFAPVMIDTLIAVADELGKLMGRRQACRSEN